MVEASSLIPATMGKMEKLAGLNKQSFTEYVVCPKCIAAYLNTKIAYKLLMERKNRNYVVMLSFLIILKGHEDNPCY